MGTSAIRLLGAIGRTVVALAAGIGCGALLVAAYIYSSLGEPLVFEGLLVTSLVYGAAIAAISIPIWLALKSIGLDGAPAAAALGFVGTGMFLVLTYAAGSHQRLDLMAYSFLPYALSGAIAGLVTQWVARILNWA